MRDLEESLRLEAGGLGSRESGVEGLGSRDEGLWLFSSPFPL